MYLKQFSTPSSLSQVPVALGDSAGAAAATVAQGGERRAPPAVVQPHTGAIQLSVGGERSRAGGKPTHNTLAFGNVPN